MAGSRNGGSKNDEMYTPEWIFEKLGLTFDVDVCAPENGIAWLPANKHYSIKDDGLAQEWQGLVWCNPPYSDSTPWVEKFLNHGNGIMLTQVSKSRAFLRLWNESEAIVMLPRDIRFVREDNNRTDIFMPVALFGMGHKAHAAFIRSGINRVR